MKKCLLVGSAGLLFVALVIVVLLAFSGSGAKLSGIAFTEDSIELLAGDSTSVSLAYEWDKELDAGKQAEAINGLEVDYISSDEAVAVVSADGEVTALDEGETQIQATVGNLTATCAVTVQPALDGIETATRTITLEVSEKATIDEIKPIPANAEMAEVMYTSSNEKTAMVDDSGEVTAVAVGRATITITCGEHTATVTVIVTEPAPEEEETEEQDENTATNDTTGGKAGNNLAENAIDSDENSGNNSSVTNDTEPQETPLKEEKLDGDILYTPGGQVYTGPFYTDDGRLVGYDSDGYWNYDLENKTDGGGSTAPNTPGGGHVDGQDLSEFFDNAHLLDEGYVYEDGMGWIPYEEWYALYDWD